MRTIGPSVDARRRSLGAEPRTTTPFDLALLRRAALCLASLASLSLWPLPLASCAPSRGTIGAVIVQDSDSGRLFLREVPPSLAAGQANLRPGDEILLIDGLDVRRLDPQQINAALSGEVDPR
jgi:hypothetical protein